MVDRIGQQFGNYRLVRQLGKGGFAEVYLGEHLYIKRQAAVKLLHTTLEQQEKFLVEAQRLVDVAHPHIVHVLDFAVEDGIPFLVMEYAPDGTLRKRHPLGSRLALEIIVPYVVQAANALQYIHDQKLVHRDIKPENMLLGSQQEVLLSDFGVAAIAHATQSLDLQGRSGTPPYMAPEQIQGKPRPASDQYALGIVVYEWLSGSPPFRGSISEIIGQHMFATPPSLRETLPSLTPRIEEVILKALKKDPKERFESVQLFAQHLEQAYQETAHPSAAFTRLLPPAISPEPVLSHVSIEDHAFSDAASSPESTQTMATTHHHSETNLIPVLAEISTPLRTTAPHKSSTLSTRRLEDDLTSDDPSLPPLAEVSPSISTRETKFLDEELPSPRKKAIPRRALVAGLAALVVGGGTIAYIIQEAEQTNRQSNIAGPGTAQQTPQNSTPQPGATAQTKTTATNTTSSGSPSGTTHDTKAPTHSPAQPGSPSGSQSGSQPSPQPTSATGATPTRAPQPTQAVQLTLQITNCPQDVNNNTDVPVTVTANQAGVSTQLIVTYDLLSDIFKSQVRSTGSNDTVVLTWHVGLVTSLLNTLLNAHVTAVATDQNGKQVQSPTVLVHVHLL